MLDWIPTSRRPQPDLESASPALLGRRAIAAVIDLLICYLVVETAILAVLMVVFLEFFLAEPGQAFLLSIVGLVPVYLLYTFLFEWKLARTPGKKRMDLLVVTDDGTDLTVRGAAIRNGLRYVDWLPIGYLLGWVLARRSGDGRRLGDRLAATVVVRPETDAPSLFDAETPFRSDDDRSASQRDG
ncbi:RDD family protein [Salinadaptatus halalkaliphilus]|uniref:RDD family protein n=1 Tax=Salinadaptatus halalkaliphilus TaxID=2419781 RepID=A0A4S3TP41_9EURY|nr:RDD family protein [Salinadaptatus halalkaliphilus]THE64358.1 RDD family protein [Salinadaptatus halalkaliphilus]